MHETSIAASILESVQAILIEHPRRRLESVKVAVGELSSVEPDLLAFAWEAIVSESPFADVRLEIEWCPARIYCSTCGQHKHRVEGSWFRICSDCGNPVQTTGGDELDIVQISFLKEGPKDS